MVIDTDYNPNNIGTRYMTIKLILDNTQFPSGSNIKIITCNSDVNSLTAEATITKATGFSNTSAYVTIYGLTLEDINSFSRFNLSNASSMPANLIEIYAGYSIDENGIPPLAYAGQIRLAAPNLNDPNRAFTIISQWGVVDQNVLMAPTAPAGAVDLNTLYEGMAKKFNPPLIYQGNEVNGTAYNPNYSGSCIEQINAATADYGCKVKQDNGKLLVAPANKPFIPDIYELNSLNGMLGYPQIEEFGISVRLRYNPTLQFGQQIKVTTNLALDQIRQNSETIGTASDSILATNGIWYINAMMTFLQNRGIKWETILKLNTTQFNTGV